MIINFKFGNDSKSFTLTKGRMIFYDNTQPESDGIDAFELSKPEPNINKVHLSTAFITNDKVLSLIFVNSKDSDRYQVYLNK